MKRLAPLYFIMRNATNTTPTTPMRGTRQTTTAMKNIPANAGSTWASRISVSSSFRPTPTSAPHLRPAIAWLQTGAYNTFNPKYPLAN